MASNIIGNRNSTPEASKSSLRPPTSRTIGTSANQTMRSSADMSSFTSPLSSRSIRPASEVLYNQQSQGLQDDNELGDQWIQVIEQYENMLEDMAAATLDQDFKDELNAIEQWFKVLSEAERTAATYALIQQTTQMQQRFFAQVLNQMSKSHPISGVLSPTNFGEKDPMSNRLSDAMSKLNIDNRHSIGGRPPVSPAGAASAAAASKRMSGLDSSTIHAMFPDAAAAIAQQRAEYAQQTGNPTVSNRNSVAIGDRLSTAGPGLSASRDSKPDGMSWRQSEPQQPPISRPKSSSEKQTPMGQFSQPPPSASLRSPRPIGHHDNIQNTTLTAPDHLSSGMAILSPYNVGNQSWASMTNTPMVPNFNMQQGATQSDMIANATAMKLAALSTVNNRIALDDVRKYRRARSNEPQPGNPQSGAPGVSATGIPGINTIMVNDHGQILNAQQVAAIHAQQMATAQGRRSRPNSPSVQVQGGLGQGNFSSPQHNGFLAAYDGGQMMLSPGLGPQMHQTQMSQFSNQFGTPADMYLADPSEINRGRSPRGRRGSSKPPEDPTDVNLLQDIPAWLRSLRLHKYTDNLKDLRWEDLIQLDEKGLEARGVAAIGARNKMLKAFEQVREAQDKGKL